MAGMETRGGDNRVPLSRGLSSRLLVLTVLFVLLAEVLIFVPSVANFRIGWLQNKIDTAGAASIVIAEVDSAMLPRNVQNDLLMSTGAHAIVLKEKDMSRLLASSEMPPEVTTWYDLRSVTAVQAIRDALATLFAGGDKSFRVLGAVGGSDRVIELVMDDAELRGAMLIYSRNVALLSLIISLITASLVFYAINRIMIRPIRHMTRSMLAFAAAPEDTSRIIAPEGRQDEIGVAERELAAMQGELNRTLSERKHLADLGLAVSKINHDMRNVLAAAQLMSDRLSDASDPVVQRIVPKLVRTLDRAIGYTSAVLSYGGAKEAPPARRPVKVSQIVDDVFSLNAQDSRIAVELVNDAVPGHIADADPDQLFRILNNLVRNAVQALVADGDVAVMRRVRVSSERRGAVTEIVVEDNGPGLPPVARENLFAAFRGSARRGGTGLGLAIAQELVKAHGGEIRLLASESGRTVFSVSIPDRPVDLQEARATRQTA